MEDSEEAKNEIIALNLISKSIADVSKDSACWEMTAESKNAVWPSRTEIANIMVLNRYQSSLAAVMTKMRLPMD